MKYTRFIKDSIVNTIGLLLIGVTLALAFSTPLLLLPAIFGGIWVALNGDVNIKVKYFDPSLTPLNKISVGDWIDLRSAETVELKAGEYRAIPLGIGMALPDEYEAYILPRSSTFKNYGVISANSMGVIDNSYAGDDDEWHFVVYATRDTKIIKNDRICQFRIMRNQPRIKFSLVEKLKKISRGGIGSTGKE